MIADFVSVMDLDVTERDRNHYIVFLKVAGVWCSKGESSKTDWQRLGKEARNRHSKFLSQHNSTRFSIFGACVYNMCMFCLCLVLI